MSEQMAQADEHYEWHEQVGRAVMFATRCTHDGDDFGGKSVCVTCFENTQAIGALVERFAHRAFEQGRRAERRDWELTADLVTPDEDRQPTPNPYCSPATPPAPTTDPRADTVRGAGLWC